MSSATTERMPPGPPLPAVVQTLGFMLAGPRWLEACRRRYGNAVTFRTLMDARFVMVFDPELVKQLFRGSNEQLHAGEANALLGPILGDRSVLLLDGAEHLRHRRLLLPAFHGERLRLFEDVIRGVADEEIDAWPIGRPFELLGSMQALTLRVIVRAVFGYEAGAAGEELARRLRDYMAPLAEPRNLVMVWRLLRKRSDAVGFARFEERRRAVDELLYAEIARRRALGDESLRAREDVFSSLLLAQDEEGGRLTDKEVRDELLTVLIAGHETTATGLAWAFDLLAHERSELERARAGDDAHLDAVVKESLRLRPVIPGVGRVVRGEPFALGPWLIPPGVEINPSIRVIHRRADLYPEPRAFRPDRFLGEDAPDTYTWVRFGGGTRRCLGASFAQTEMRIVLRRVLDRVEFEPASDKPERVQFRGITLVPRDGTRIVVRRRAALRDSGTSVPAAMRTWSG